MSEQKHTPEPCQHCNGNGWTAEHAPGCSGECSTFGCPYQVQCDKCMGTGLENPATEIERLWADRAALVEALKNLPGYTTMSNSHDSWFAGRGPGEGEYVDRRDMEEAITKYGCQK